MKKVLRYTLLLFSALSFSQSNSCSCEDKFKWMKETFEQNDAGFQYVIDKKGKTEYNRHNELILERIKNAKDDAACVQVMYDWLYFFRKGHIAIRQNSQQNNQSGAIEVNKPNWPVNKTSVDKFKKQLSKTKEPGLEGIWTSLPYTVAIVKKDKGYEGFIVDAPGTPWQKGQVKLILDAEGKKGTYYLRNYSEFAVTDVKFFGNNHVYIGNFLFNRIYPEAKDPANIAQHFELMSSDKPIGKQLSPDTFILRIPYFNYNQKNVIDSVINASHDKIIASKNLIIDVRNNGGGADRCYQELIKYLYTNPIRTIGVEMLSTKLNNARMDEFLADPDLSETERKDILNSKEKLNANLGKFINLNDWKVYIDTMDTVYAYPQKVAILVNNGNASTTEQFLLAAKQSTKVKLYGVTTEGMLDVSNMNFVESPCGNITLGYCLSKSYRIPHMAIDDIGLQPDYYIDDSIPDYEWIEYAEKMMSNK